MNFAANFHVDNDTPLASHVVVVPGHTHAWVLIDRVAVHADADDFERIAAEFVTAANDLRAALADDAVDFYSVPVQR